MTDVDCEYKDKCTSHPNWCETCARNKGKRNFYVPLPYPYYLPVIYPYTGPWIIDTGSSGATGNYYLSGSST